MWYHTTIIDTLRPFRIRPGSKQWVDATRQTPTAICEASLNQLKSLAVTYRYNQPSSLYSILHHTSLLYIGNAVLGPRNQADWRFFWDLCVSTYIELYTCYRICAGFLQGLLELAINNHYIHLDEGRAVLGRLIAKGKTFNAPVKFKSAHLIDFELALSHPGSGSAQIEQCSERVVSLALRDDPDPLMPAVS